MKWLDRRHPITVEREVVTDVTDGLSAVEVVIAMALRGAGSPLYPMDMASWLDRAKDVAAELRRQGLLAHNDGYPATD